MAKKAFLKDHDDIEILPITRGELVLDSSGNPAFSSNEFLATTSQPGLMSKEDKIKIDNLSSIGELTDEKVKQIATTTNASYRLLFSGTADDTTRIEYAGKSSKLLYNPSTGYLTSTKFVGDLAGTASNSSNLDGIAASEYFRYRGPIVNNTDLDTLFISGIRANEHGNGTGNSNFPSGHNYGYVIGFKGDTSYYKGVQLVIDSSGTDLKVRTHWANTWKEWKTIAYTTSNITGNAATATRTKYIETMTYTGESWYGDKYKLYAKWFNGTICDWKSTDDTNNEYQVRVDIAKKLNTPRLLWGNKFDGTQSLDGNITIRNQGTVSFAIADGTSVVDAIQVNISDHLLIGQGVAKNSGDTLVYGNNIKFCYGTAGTSAQTAMTITDAGNVLVGASYIPATLPAPKMSVHGGLLCVQAVGSALSLNSLPDRGLVLGGNGHALSQYLENSGNFSIQAHYIGDGTVRALNLNPRGGTVNIGVGGLNVAGTITGNLDGTYVNKLTGYTKATAISALAATDTLNTALGKLEYKADVAYNLVKGAYDGDGTIENLEEILRVLDGIKDTETIKAIVGKYLPLSGGELTGSISYSFVTSGGDATGWWYKNNGTRVAGIGALGESGNLQHIFLGWGTSPWLESNSLAVSDTKLKYKGFDIIHAGNWNQFTVSKDNLMTYVNNNTDYVSANLPSEISKIAVSKYIEYWDGSTGGNGWFNSKWGTITAINGFVGNVTGDVTGNASSATKLQTARTIWGQSFNGTNNLCGDLFLHPQNNDGNALSTNLVFTGYNGFYYGPVIGTKNTSNGGGYGRKDLVFLQHNNTTWPSNSNSHIEVMRITTNGSVGIGTSAPLEHLDVLGKIRSKGLIIHDHAGSNHWYYTRIATVYQNQSPNYLNGAMVFYTMYESHEAGSEVERMRISANGNVGIGTSAPEARLHVNGSLLINNTSSGEQSIIFRTGTASEYGTYDYKIGKFTDANDVTGFGFAMNQSDGSWKKFLNITTSGTYVVQYVDILAGLTVSDYVHSSGFVKYGSNNNYILLGGGGHKAISDFLLKSEIANQELNNNLTTITKSLTVTADWMDTGIDGDDLPTGTYIVQVSCAANTGLFYDCYWSGVMSWWKGRTNDTESDEIILHRVSRQHSATIYLRTLSRSNTDTNGLKLQIAASQNIGAAYTYTFKFKRVI